MGQTTSPSGGARAGKTEKSEAEGLKSPFLQQE